VNILLSDRMAPFICIIAIDSRVAINCFAINDWHERPIVNGYEYLKKIINVPVCLPEVRQGNVQLSYDASLGGRGEGLLKLSECRHMKEGVWPNRHITFIVIEKSLIHSSSCSIYGICGERGLVENVI